MCVLNLQYGLAEVDMFVLLEMGLFLQLHMLLNSYVFVFCLSATAAWYCWISPKMSDGFLLKSFLDSLSSCLFDLVFSVQIELCSMFLQKSFAQNF